jgi:hypothetical protein
MPLARVVSFEEVNKARIDELRRELDTQEAPDDVPAKELVMLHDPEGERSLVILFFDNEEDYARGDAALNAMDTSETPGRRTSVAKYDVALRMAMS